MIAGNRQVFIATMFGAGLLLFAAADTHTPGLPRAPGILVAPELLQAPAGIMLLDCAAGVQPGRLELRFERITAEPDREEIQRLLSHTAQRPVDFIWDSAAGELAYAAPPTFTPPATRGATPSPPLQASCGSR